MLIKSDVDYFFFKIGMKSLCPHSSFLERDDTHGSFLLITFTRAECKNVQKRWAKILRDCSGAEFTSQVREMCEKSSSSAVRHISEIDLKLASFDVIFWAPLIGCVLRAFDPLFDVLLSLATPVPSPLPLELQPQHSQVIPETQSMGLGPQVMPRINASSIPLLYFTCGTIRLFFPKTAPNLNVSLHRECGTEHVKSKNIHRLEADLLVLQIVGINIASNADNPLSRVLLKPDVYNIAQRAGILAIPGSEVEDRQYQVDITGLSLHTGELCI